MHRLRPCQSKVACWMKLHQSTSVIIHHHPSSSIIIHHHPSSSIIIHHHHHHHHRHRHHHHHHHRHHRHHHDHHHHRHHKSCKPRGDHPHCHDSLQSFVCNITAVFIDSQMFLSANHKHCHLYHWQEKTSNHHPQILHHAPPQNNIHKMCFPTSTPMNTAFFSECPLVPNNETHRIHVWYIYLPLP